MSKTSKLFLGIFIGVASIIMTFRMINQAPSERLHPDDKFRAIVENSGCNMCHNPAAKLPFYSNWPLIGRKIQRDASDACSKIDLSIPFKLFENGEKIDNESLNRIEEVISNGSMPPFSFTILRPGSAVSSKEEDILLNWIESQRSRIESVSPD
ncbi:MAG: heme-binding domain-containing protein [Bacteroidales bacterium]